jgi:hypothetical protein
MIDKDDFWTEDEVKSLQAVIDKQAETAVYLATEVWKAARLKSIDAVDKKINLIQDAVIKAFGRNPVGCNGALHVSVESYNGIVDTINADV